MIRAANLANHQPFALHVVLIFIFMKIFANPIALATISPTIRLISASRVLLTVILAILTESVQAAAILAFANCLILLCGVFLRQDITRISLKSVQNVRLPAKIVLPPTIAVLAATNLFYTTIVASKLVLLVSTTTRKL